jgi:protein-S-isoprenylcysteine O-methyltransferase Ste14
MVDMTEHRMAGSSDSPGVVAMPPFLYGGAFLLVLLLRALWPLPIVERGSLLWPGLALAAIGVGIAIWGRRTMVAAGTNVRPSLPATAIVTTGPFRFSRNPLYCALTLLYLGLTAVFNTWWGVIVLVPLLLVMHVGVVLREERYLERKFGETYRQYRTSVRRYL